MCQGLLLLRLVLVLTVHIALLAVLYDRESICKEQGTHGRHLYEMKENSLKYTLATYSLVHDATKQGKVQKHFRTQEQALNAIDQEWGAGGPADTASPAPITIYCQTGFRGVSWGEPAGGRRAKGISR